MARSSMRAALLLAALATSAGSARAQPVPGPSATDDRAAAVSEVARRAQAAVAAGRYAEAVAVYRAGLAANDEPALHLGLARALAHLDDPVAVVDALERALVPGPHALADDERAWAADALALARRGVVDVEIAVTARDAVLTIDGVQVQVGPGTWSGRLRAGAHQLVVTAADGRARNEYATPLVGGAPLRLRLDPVIALDDAPPRRRPLPAWAGYAIGAAGITTAFAGYALQANAHSLAEDYEDRRAGCAGDDACELDPALLAQRDRARTRRGLGFGLYGAGGALVALGALIVWRERPRPHASPLALVPVLDRHVAGLAATGSF
jgi:hypothetical protein